jgi:Mn-dependent DtxR family transcriptional regulator
MSKVLSALASRVLTALRELPEEQRQVVTNNMLAESLGISPFTVSRSLGELQRAGIVTFEWRSPNPGEGRWSGRIVHLSDK